MKLVGLGKGNKMEKEEEKKSWVFILGKKRISFLGGGIDTKIFSDRKNFFLAGFFVLFCFVLFCFVLFCFVLFCFVLFCFVLFVCLFV